MKPSLLLAALTIAVALPASAQHFHINAGVLDANGNGQPDIGEALAFANGAEFDLASGFTLSLTYRTTGRYAGRYSGIITFTALAALAASGGPETGHAALGAHIEMRLVGVTGPDGGTFSFWEPTGTEPAFSVAAGTSPSPSVQWALSENSGLPGEDPFGHIHGRQFSVNQPGAYDVTFQLFDTSTNGPGAGPLHAPSGTFTMRFVAVPEPGVVTLIALAGGVVLAGSRLRRRGRFVA